MKHCITNIFLYCFLFISTVLPGEEFYRSNSIGMVFEKIPALRVNDFDWTLKISRDGLIESRSIYYQGNEVKRFEYIKEGNNLTVNQYVSDTMVHMEHLESGLISFEKYFKDGDIVEQYAYEWQDRQLHKIIYTENQKLIYEDVFVIDTKGRIKQIRRLYDAGNKQLAGFSYTDNAVTTGWYGKNNDFLLYRYNAGRIVEIDNWQGGVLSSTIKITFSETGKTVIESDISTKKLTVKIFDTSDRILSEEIREGDFFEKTIYLYKNNLLIQKKISSSGLREIHHFEYYSDDSLKLEKILKDNMLFKEIYYKSKEKVKEKIYKNGLLVLIISFENGKKTNEEFIK